MSLICKGAFIRMRSFSTTISTVCPLIASSSCLGEPKGIPKAYKLRDSNCRLPGNTDPRQTEPEMAVEGNPARRTPEQSESPPRMAFSVLGGSIACAPVNKARPRNHPESVISIVRTSISFSGEAMMQPEGRNREGRQSCKQRNCAWIV